jgi:inositol phosphorylceramide synthase catalytic subunit
VVAPLVGHVRRLWPGGGVWLPVPFVAWPLYCLLIGEARMEHLAFALLVPALAYTTPQTKKLFVGLLPFGLLGLVYDTMRYIKDVGVTPARVHVCDLRALDQRLFGVGDATLGDWLQAHATPWLDRLCAVPYGTFIYVSLAVAVWLYFKDYEGLRRFGWTFLLVNLAGFVTYHVYPAAPPWYFHAHGCTVDMTTHANEGVNLARVDAWLGVKYFAGFYGRSSDVFGAVPSLHVAYPLLNLLFGWRHWRWPGRALATAFFLLMGFSAVYLDHHWVVDVVLGIFYTLVVWRLVRFALDRRARREVSRPDGATSPELVGGAS